MVIQAFLTLHRMDFKKKGNNTPKNTVCTSETSLCDSQEKKIKKSSGNTPKQKNQWYKPI